MNVIKLLKVEPHHQNEAAALFKEGQSYNENKQNKSTRIL